MKLQLIAATALTIGLVSLGYTQVSQVQAGTSPITGPVTGPVTPPVTLPPVTLPPVKPPVITVYQVQGRLTRVIASRWLKSIKQVLPIANHTVVIQDTKTKQVRTVKTKSNGEYSVLLPVGTYTVTPQVSMGVSFTPNSRKVTVLRALNGLDFVQNVYQIK